MSFYLKQQSPGACLALNDVMKSSCRAEHNVCQTNGCPSKIGFLAVILLGAYIISYSPVTGIGDSALCSMLK